MNKDYIHSMLDLYNQKGLVKSMRKNEKPFSLDRFNRALIKSDSGTEIVIPKFTLNELLEINKKIDCKILLENKEAPYLLRVRTAVVKNNDKQSEFFLSYAKHDKRCWNVAEVKIDALNPPTDDIEFAFTTTHTIWLQSFYEWHCLVREDNDSRIIKFWCQPELMKEIFKMREKRGTRRKAIVNIIHEYQRRQKTSDGVKTKLIEQHFRGESSFEFDGLQISVVPSSYDISRITSSKTFESHL